MRAQSLIWGLLGLIPAFVLVFSASEFDLINPEGELGPKVLTALLMALSCSWSCYIMSVVPILQNRDVPTSMEGMTSSVLVGVPFAAGLIAFHYFKLDHFTVQAGFDLAIGMMATAILQGFYIGFSKARLGAEEAKAFFFRLTGLLVSTFLLFVYIFLAYKADASWSLSVSIFLAIGTLGLLALLLMRASRQRKRYLARRYKPRTKYNVEGAAI